MDTKDPAAAQTVPVARTMRGGVSALLPQLQPLFGLLEGITGKPMAGAGTYQKYTPQRIDSPEGAAAIDAATMRLANGTYTANDINILKQAGLITASDATDFILGSGGGGSGGGGGGGGSGGGGGGGSATAWASLAQREREFQYEQEQDRIANAMANIKMLADAQARDDALRMAAQEAQLAALPYMAAPGQTHFGGFEQDAYAVRQGLATPQRIAPLAFDPNAVAAPGQYDDRVAAEMAKWSTMAGL